MSVSRITAHFDHTVEEVWNAVTSLENCDWRRDLERIDVINDRQFIEYTKDGYATYFTTTVFDPCKLWEFDMENSKMKGHWVGSFYQSNDGTYIEFTETVTAKKFIMRLFVKPYLKKQQEEYISDLKKSSAKLSFMLKRVRRKRILGRSLVAGKIVCFSRKSEKKREYRYRKNMRDKCHQTIYI